MVADVHYLNHFLERNNIQTGNMETLTITLAVIAGIIADILIIIMKKKTILIILAGLLIWFWVCVEIYNRAK